MESVTTYLWRESKKTINRINVIVDDDRYLTA
jgi:hypothetical protein